MASIPKDLWCYARALWREWKVNLTGGSLIALLTLWALIGQRPIPQNLAWLIVALTFLAASFLAWRKERTEQRIFVDETISRLMLPYKDHTRVQADLILKGYKGKWLNVTGNVREVSEHGFKPGHEVLLHVDGESVALRFSREWDKHILLLRKQQLLSAVGKIVNIDGMIITLEDCEIPPSTLDQHP